MAYLARSITTMQPYKLFFMFMRKLISILCILFVTALPSWSQTKSTPSPAGLHFLKGKRLIENNCIDCQGGTATGTEEGIREIQAAIESGYANRVAAYKLLSNAYANMATYVEKAGPKQSEEYWAKRADVQRMLYALKPKDPLIAEEYAATLKTDEQKIPVLRKTVEANPDKTAPAFDLGASLVRTGHYAEGLQFMENSVNKETDPEVLQNDLVVFIETLRIRGCPLENERQWTERIGAAFQKANAGTGKPAGMDEIKGQFLSTVKDHPCGKADTKQ